MAIIISSRSMHTVPNLIIFALMSAVGLIVCHMSRSTWQISVVGSYDESGALTTTQNRMTPRCPPKRLPREYVALFDSLECLHRCATHIVRFEEIVSKSTPFRSSFTVFRSIVDGLAIPLSRTPPTTTKDVHVLTIFSTR